MHDVSTDARYSKVERGRYLMEKINGAGFDNDDFIEFCELVRGRFHVKGIRMKTIYCFPFGMRAPSKKKQIDGLRKSFCLTYKQARFFLKYAGAN